MAFKYHVSVKEDGKWRLLATYDNTKEACARRDELRAEGRKPGIRVEKVES